MSKSDNAVDVLIWLFVACIFIGILSFIAKMIHIFLHECMRRESVQASTGEEVVINHIIAKIVEQIETTANYEDELPVAYQV